MQNITSRPIELKKDIRTIFGMLNNPALLNPILEKFRDKIPAKKIELGADKVLVDVGMMGDIILEKSNSMEPTLVEYKSVKSPMPVTLTFNLSEESADKTLGQIGLALNVPPFLSGMIRSKAEPIMGEIAEFLEKIDFDRLMTLDKE